MSKKSEFRRIAWEEGQRIERERRERESLRDIENKMLALRVPICFYDSSKYSSFEDASSANAIFKTDNDIINDPNDDIERIVYELLDAIEMLQALSECFGKTNYICGYESDDKFIEIVVNNRQIDI